MLEGSLRPPARSAGAPSRLLFGFGDFCAFGGISFQLLGSPEKLNRNYQTHYAKLPLLGQKPVLQWTYDDLAIISMGIRLHVTWCDPDSAVGLLDQQRLSHQPAPLVFGAGIPLGSLFGGGSSGGIATQFVVTKLTVTDLWRYAGVAQHIDVQMTLSEWAPTLPQGAPTVAPSAPTAGIIGVPGGFEAIYSAGDSLGLPIPGQAFAGLTMAVATRAGAL